MKLRVLHVFKTYWPDAFGGIERAIDAIARSTAAHGFESEVFFLSRDPAAGSGEFHGQRTTKAKLDLEVASTGLSFSAPAMFARSAARADIVHYHFPWPFMDVMHFMAGHGKPSLLTYHSDIVKQRTLNRLYRPLMNRFLGRMDRIVATSPNYARTSPVLQRFASKVSVVPIGIDEVAYPRSAADEISRTRQQFPDGFFLFVGVLRYYKGLGTLVAAARQTGYSVVIAGDGPLAGELERSLTATDTNIHLLGSVSEQQKMAMLGACEAFVFPSDQRSEAYGVSLLEAAMAGRPMITCEIGTGTSFINLDRETGLVVEPANAAALADAMREIRNRPERAAVWGNAAAERFRGHFTSEMMGKAYAGLYRDLADVTTAS